MLGLTADARVRVRAPGIEVVLTGDPEIVRAVLSAVKSEISRNSSRKRLESQARPTAEKIPARVPALAVVQGQPLEQLSDSNIVLPSDLDEMDSPYAIPDHHTLPPVDETPIDGLQALAGPNEKTRPENLEIVASDERTRDDEPEPEVTAVDVKNPSGGNPLLSLKPHLMPQVAETTADSTIGSRASSRSDGARRRDPGTDPDA